MDYLLSANAPGDLCTLMLFCSQDAHITKLHAGPGCTRRRVAIRGTVLLCRTAALDTGVKYWMHFTLPAFRKVAQPLKSNGNKRICHFFAWTLIYVVLAITQQWPNCVNPKSERVCCERMNPLPVCLRAEPGAKRFMSGDGWRLCPPCI